MVKRVASVLALASVAFAYRPTPMRMALPRADVLRPFQEGRALKVGANGYSCVPRRSTPPVRHGGAPDAVYRWCMKAHVVSRRVVSCR